MQVNDRLRSRRDILRGGTLAAACWTVPGLFAEQLRETAAMMEGPFYPDKMPLDVDNDLVVINNSLTPAVGEITYLSGAVMTAAGTPLRDVTVEIWQVDAKASYLHTKGVNPNGHDGNFQGFGRFSTDAKGRYQFRTIKPVPYVLGNVSRTPHIHIALNRGGRRIFTTQILIRGHEMNGADRLFQLIKDPNAAETVLTDFRPARESKLGELNAKFDIVLGRTWEEQARREHA